MKTETQSKTAYQKGLTDQFSLFTLIKQPPKEVGKTHGIPLL